MSVLYLLKNAANRPGHNECSYGCYGNADDDKANGCEAKSGESDPLQQYDCICNHGDKCNNVACSQAGLDKFKADVENPPKEGNEGDDANANSVSVAVVLICGVLVHLVN